MRRFLLIAGVALVYAPAAKAAPLSLMKTRHTAVQVRVNGAGPFRLIFDTGSPVTFFGNAAALKAGLLSADQAKRPALLGLRGRTVAKTVEIGGMAVRDIPVMVLDHPTIQQIAQVDGPVDGIIGLSFFGRFKTTLDYSRSEILLQPGDFQPKEVTEALSSRLFNRQPGKRTIASSGLWGVRVEKPDEEPGVRIAEVFAGGAAHAAGLNPGDRLLTLDGRWTDSIQDTYEAAALVKPGTAANVRVFREGKELELVVTPRSGL